VGRRIIEPMLRRGHGHARNDAEVMAADRAEEEGRGVLLEGLVEGQGPRVQ
jgi:hypothetical protein